MVAIPSTPDVTTRRSTRGAEMPTIQDKENMPPPRVGPPSTPAASKIPLQSTPARLNGMPLASTPMGKALQHTPARAMNSHGGHASTPLAKAAPNQQLPETPAGNTGTMPKTLEEWHDVLIDLPTVTVSDKARLFRLYERALGSGEGCEELDVSAHKENQKV